MKKQRIVIIYSEDVACDFHRMLLPSKYLQGTTVNINGEDVELDFVSIKLDINEKFIKEEMLQNGDIVWFHWLVANGVADFGTWKASKNIKILYSIDDYWYYSENHPYLHKLKNMKDRVLQFVFEADVVLTSTERLGQHLLKFNPFVSYNPNFLPNDLFTPNKTKSDKLRIGLVGSSSHLPDYKLLKGAINRIAKNKELCNNIEFHIYGYTNTLLEIKQMFEKKKNISLIVHEPISLDNYMELYNNLDIIFTPLEDNEYNYCKSALKISECLISDTIMVGSKLYDGKELTGYCKAETPLEYENWLIYLSNRENYNKTLQYLKEANKSHDFEGRVDSLKAMFKVLISSDFNYFPKDINIYGITYDSNQVTEYKQYHNIPTEKQWRFEYGAMLAIRETEEYKNYNNEDYVSFLSWKFPQKTGLTKKILGGILSENNYKNYDIILPSRKYWKNSDEYLQFSYKTHPKLKELLEKVLNNLGKSTDIPKNVNYTYSNFWIMKKEHLEEYFDKWLIPSLNYMENEIWDEVNVDANYNFGVSKEELMKNTKLEFYNYPVFILERLFIFFMYEKQLKVLNLL